MRRAPASVLIALVALVALLPSAGCPRPGGGGPSDSFDRRAMLANLAAQVIVPAIQAFRDECGQLAAETETMRLAVGTTAHAAALVSTRSALGEAMEAWQRVEVYQLGPTANIDMATGALGLRDEIYSWPTVNACRVDQEIVSQDYEDPAFFDNELVNVYGLAALEYLLFEDGPDNQCAPQVDINSSGSWSALGIAEITARRGAYADVLADRLAADSEALFTAWSPSGGNFAGALANAGLSGSPYGSAQGAVNELFAAIFYVELVVKDAKLAMPAGISADCTSATCPEALESRWSGRSKENAAANMRAFRAVLLGGETAASGLGFDDFLVELGAPELAAGMEAKTDAAIAAIEAIPGTMEEALASDLASVVAAHAAVKAMTDDLKSTFVTVLNLRVPDEGAGDND